MRAIGSVLLFATAVVAGAARAEQDNYVDVQRGKALATIGDCIACHTAPGGKPFARWLCAADTLRPDHDAEPDAG